MPSAKRAARKTSSAGKARSASPAKGRAGRADGRKSTRKAQPAARKAAPKPAKRAAPAPKAKAAPKAARPAKPAAAARTAASSPAKAAPAKAPAAREMVVRTTPGLVKTGGRKPAPARRNNRRPDVYDPNALIHGIRPYQTRPGEAYMSPAQLDHFRMILQAWKRELMEEVDRTVHHMQDEASNFPDPNDRATQESEFGLELRTRDRERKLLKKIDAALERIEDGSYGYCEETGEEIGLKRLEARPVATLSLEAQERREMAERQYGERDDRYR